MQKLPTLRPQRLASRVLAEVRRWRWLPIFPHSVVLIDISRSGCKIEFTDGFVPRIGASYWIVIPLRPLGMMAPPTLICPLVCRWYDPKRQRSGVMFGPMSPQDRQTLDSLIHTLLERRRRMQPPSSLPSPSY